MRNKIFLREEIARQDIDVLKRRLRKMLSGYRISFRSIVAGARLFRGVRRAERPTDIRQVSYPPGDKVTALGRLNRIGEAMFYCSAGEPPVYYELKASAGDKIAVSEWEVIEPLWLHHLGYHEDALSKLGVPISGSRPYLTNPIPFETKENEALRRKLSLALAEDVSKDHEYKYKLSIAINELLFDKAGPIPLQEGGPPSDCFSGTVYPSVQINARADNFAIRPQFVDSSLRIISIKYFSVNSFSYAEGYNVTFLSYADKFDGDTIVWSF